MAKFRSDNFVKNLPDAYRKDKDSNNHKILAIDKHSSDKLRSAANSLFESLDIRQATGGTLDLYGEIYGQPRDGMDDDKYRLYILLKMAQNRAGSDHTSIINALVSALNVPAETFYIKDAETSGCVNVEIFPYDALQAAGVTVKQCREIIETLLAAGVGLERLNVTHDMPDTPLIMAATITHAETFNLGTEAHIYETLTADAFPAIVLTHSESYA